MHVTVMVVEELDPEHVEDWAEANYDTDSVHVSICDLDEGTGLGGPIVFEDGPAPQEQAIEAMEEDND